MKLLLIYPDINTIQFYHFRNGLASISATLKRAGHRVELLYIDQPISNEELVARVRESAPDIIGVSASTQQWPFTVDYARALRQAFAIPMVVGGLHATISPEETMEEGGFDLLIRGEGEYPLLELMDSLEQGRDYSAIENLWLRKNGEIVRNPLRPPPDLATLPWVDRELFDEKRLMEVNDRQVSMMTARGCPYNCTYCCNTVLAELSGGVGKWLRRREIDDVMAELAHVHALYPEMKSIIFWDEVFTTHKKWTQKFCEEYKKRFATPFQVFIRVETVDREMLKMLAEAGLYSIIVGVESGNERLRREVLNRRMTNEQIVNVFKWADEFGLETWDFNIIGIPGESEAEIRETMALNRVIRPDHVQVSVFYPFPGTPLHDRCVAEGITPAAANTSIFRGDPVLDLPGLPRERIRELYQEFTDLANEIEAEKAARGYADLTARFGEARVEEGAPGYVKLWRVRIGGEDRMSVLMHPPSRASFSVHVRPRSALRFGMAMSPDVYDKPGPGVIFEVRVKQLLRRERTIFSEEIDPKRNPAHRGWQDREVDLNSLGGKKVELILVTRTAAADNQHAASFWSRPHLAERNENGRPKRR